jgi:hypothetical protein
VKFDGFACGTPASEKSVKSDKVLLQKYASNVGNANDADDVLMRESSLLDLFCVDTNSCTVSSLPDGELLLFSVLFLASKGDNVLVF